MTEIDEEAVIVGRGHDPGNSLGRLRDQGNIILSVIGTRVPKT
jgi:hypothetical protein